MPKTLDNFIRADPRWSNHVRRDSLGPGPFRFAQPQDMFLDIEKFTLNSSVPEKVRSQFDLALNLYLYHWFVYEFVTLAEQQAYAAVEAALRYRYREDLGDPNAKAMLKKLLDHATSRGWLKVSDYEFEMPGSPTGKFSILDLVRMLRNNLGHGEFHLMQAGSHDALEWCQKIINTLFPATASASA